MRRGIYILPTVFTVGNAVCGYVSVINTIRGDYEAAGWLIILAMLFDFLDGKIARLTGTTSNFGKEIDSLSDMISFGLAPSILTYMWALKGVGRIGMIASILYFVAGMLRLARFNIRVDHFENMKYFIGLPIPASAGSIATFVIMSENYDVDFIPHMKMFLCIYMFLLVYLMVSNIPYASGKKIDLKKRKPFKILVVLLLLFFIIASYPGVILFFLFLSYVMSGLLRRFSRIRAVSNMLSRTGRPAA